MTTTTRQACTRCGMHDDAPIHHATANGHEFAAPATTTTGRRKGQVTLEQLEIADDEIHPRAVAWERHAELLGAVTFTGDQMGRILVTLGVDGWFDDVKADLHHTSDLDGLNEAITALTRVRDQLAAMYGDQAPAGQCISLGDTGRCKGMSGHEEACTYPTDAEMYAEIDTRAAARDMARKVGAR